MKVTAAFVRSAARAADLQDDGRPEIALVGRSNVGKSSLINALVRQRIARASAAPGKTRLVNIYSVTRGSAPAISLVDLPGYGYARGGSPAAPEFDALTRAYFGREGLEGQVGREGQEGRERPDRRESKNGSHPPAHPATPALRAALLLVDARHPGLASDIEAWRWLSSTIDRCGLVATKIDKLSRAERQRAMQQFEAVYEHPVLPVSAVTGEGLENLWTLIDKLTSHQPQPRRRSPPRPPAPPRPKK